MENLIKVEGRNGSKTIKTTATDRFFGFMVTEACVFTALNEEGVDVLAAQGKNGAVSVPAGTYVTPVLEYFDLITISSGTIEAYRL